MIFALRDLDDLVSFSLKNAPDFSDKAFREKLGLALFVCRLAVFIVFLVWVNPKSPGQKKASSG